MWNFFDKIYCINLTERKDRYENCLKIFNKYKIPVTFFFAEREKNGDRGCFHSHVKVCQDAKKNNYKRIIIFEDDVIDTDETSFIKIKYCINILKKINWNIFYFGCFPDIRKTTYRTEFTNIYKVKAYGAHAYALNKNYINKISKLKWKNISYDSYLMVDYQYGYIPRLFDQSASKSNIERTVNIINNFAFLKKQILNLNDFYAVNIRINIFIFLFLVFVILIILIKYKQYYKK